MSTLKADTIQSTGGGAATLTKQSAAKAFTNYDQAANTIRSSLNTSSATDVTTSTFIINLTNATNNIYYSVYGSFSMSYGSQYSAGYSMHTNGTAERAPTTSSYSLRSLNTSSSSFDAKYNMLAVDGDLA